MVQISMLGLLSSFLKSLYFSVILLFINHTSLIDYKFNAPKGSWQSLTSLTAVTSLVSRLGAQNTQNVGAHGGEGACTLSAKIDNRHWERINVGTLRKKRNSKKDNEITPV